MTAFERQQLFMKHAGHFKQFGFYKVHTSLTTYKTARQENGERVLIHLTLPVGTLVFVEEFFSFRGMTKLRCSQAWVDRIIVHSSDRLN